MLGGHGQSDRPRPASQVGHVNRFPQWLARGRPVAFLQGISRHNLRLGPRDQHPAVDHQIETPEGPSA